MRDWEVTVRQRTGRQVVKQPSDQTHTWMDPRKLTKMTKKQEKRVRGKTEHWEHKKTSSRCP